MSTGPRRSVPHPAAALLRERSISQSVIAERLGCSASHVNQCVNGRSPAPPRLRAEVAAVLGLPEEQCWRAGGSATRLAQAQPAKAYLILNRVSQVEVAEATGLSAQWVHRVLHGRGDPPARLVEYLSERLNLPAELLFHGVDEVDSAEIGGDQ